MWYNYIRKEYLMKKCVKVGCRQYLSKNSDSFYCVEHETKKYAETLPVLTVANLNRKEKVTYE